MHKLKVTITFLLILTGCGGGSTNTNFDSESGDSNTQDTIPSTIIRNLAGNQKLLKFEVAGKSVIAAGIQGDNSLYSPSNTGHAWHYEGDNTHGVSYSDNVNIDENGTTTTLDDRYFYVYRTQTKDGQEVVYVSESFKLDTPDPADDFGKLVGVSAFGDTYNQTALTGEYTYEGVHVIIPPTLRDTRTYEPSLEETGSFKIVVDFDNNTGTLLAGTGNYLTSFISGKRFTDIVPYQPGSNRGVYLVTSENLAFDQQTGEFQSNNVSITNNETSTTATATINGVLHGDGGGISGVYNATETPELIGLISGAKVH